jgi:CDP-paratose 2-epimerase
MVLKALVTGSGGLIGSTCARMLLEQGWKVTGLDNNMRSKFLGPAASTDGTVEDLRRLPGYTHEAIDIRNRDALTGLFYKARGFDFIIHAAGQPSHDRSASIPQTDFEVNAVGTLNLLQAARFVSPNSPFCFCSTNKVYGDRPNSLEMYETAMSHYLFNHVDENVSIDASMHSPFGASKLAADVMCQEYGRYFEMPIGIFRLGCITGAQHAAVELHGFLAYIVECAVTGKEYKIYGHKGKQVRDQLHARDLARLFMEFYQNPSKGEVFNVGGGRKNSASILEVIDMLAKRGFPLNYSYDPTPRRGDHICYITDLHKVQARYPNWRPEFDLGAMIEELIQAKLKAKAA